MKQARLFLFILPFLFFHVWLGGVYGRAFDSYTNRSSPVVSFKIRNLPGVAHIPLPRRDDYLLKTWGDDVPDRVTWNGQRIVPTFHRSRKILQEFYFWIPRSLVLTDRHNLLEVYPPKRFTYKIANHLVGADFGAIAFGTTRPHRVPLAQIQAVTIPVLVTTGLSLVLWLRYVLRLPFFWIVLVSILPHVPALIFFALLNFLERFVNVNFFVRTPSFAGFLALLFIFSFLLILPFLRFYKPRPVRVAARDIPEWLSENRMFRRWQALTFSRRLAAVGILLLLLSAATFIFRLAFVAEILANVAFVSLAAALCAKFFMHSDMA